MTVIVIVSLKKNKEDIVAMNLFRSMKTTKTDRQIMEEASMFAEAYMNGDITEKQYEIKMEGLSNMIPIEKGVDIDNMLYDVSKELDLTGISKLELEVRNIDIEKIGLSTSAKNIAVESKYRMLINRKCREKELSATHVVSVKNTTNPMDSSLITVSLRLRALNADAASYTKKLMQWSLDIAEAYIRKNPKLNQHIAKDAVFPKCDRMYSRTENFDGCIIHASTEDKMISGVVTEHSTMPLTAKVTRNFSDDKRCASISPVTITNFNNL